MNFCTFASGSSGNCAYVALGGEHFLLDAGISGKRVAAALAQQGSPPLSGILVTHEHGDHITGLGVVARRFGVPIFATPLTWRYLLRHAKLGPLPETLVRHIEPGDTVQVGHVRVAAFDVPHDAAQPVGYTLTAGDEKLAWATDLGHATDTVAFHLKNAQLIYVESNHDEEMVHKSRYHQSLKDRVLGKRGHLSNVACGELLCQVCAPHTHVVLAHLSEENNYPMLAQDTVGRILDANEIPVARLVVAERSAPGDVMVI